MNRGIKALARVAPLFLLVAIADSSLAGDTHRLGQEDDIREAVFRFQFDHNGSGQQKQAHAYCIAILEGGKDSDPSDQFMKRFAHHKPPVRKFSACHWTEIQVVENRTGRSALIFRVSQISWVSNTEVTVDGGYDEGNVSSSGNTYTVGKQNGKWVVANDQMNVISKRALLNGDSLFTLVSALVGEGTKREFMTMV
ncbi:MAG: hypothetical protein ACLPHP_13620 [Candidatus Sulfotelmatobacter sp.]